MGAKFIVMKNETEIKELVKEKYGQSLHNQKHRMQAPVAAPLPAVVKTCIILWQMITLNLKVMWQMLILGLGCGLPTEFAQIKEGDIVIDLGSGAGNDAFIARRITGEKGKVIGIDFTEAMIARARENAEKLGYNNVEFRQGDIDSMPVTANKADVIVSNCVLNLVPNKHKVFSEIYRVLKPGGHFSISDIVLEGPLPDKWKEVAELYAGCVSGAIQKNEYLGIIEEAGFKKILVQKDKTINIPDDILAAYLSEDEIREYKKGSVRIASITVYAEKAAKDDRNCCEPGSGCC